MNRIYLDENGRPAATGEAGLPEEFFWSTDAKNINHSGQPTIGIGNSPGGIFLGTPAPYPTGRGYYGPSPSSDTPLSSFATRLPVPSQQSQVFDLALEIFRKFIPEYIPNGMTSEQISERSQVAANAAFTWAEAFISKRNSPPSAPVPSFSETIPLVSKISFKEDTCEMAIEYGELKFKDGNCVGYRKTDEDVVLKESASLPNVTSQPENKESK